MCDCCRTPSSPADSSSVEIEWSGATASRSAHVFVVGRIFRPVAEVPVKETFRREFSSRGGSGGSGQLELGCLQGC